MTRTAVRACRLGALHARDSKRDGAPRPPVSWGILELRLDRVGVALLVVDAYTGTKQSLFVCVRFFGEQFFCDALVLFAGEVCVAVIGIGKVAVTFHTVKHTETCFVWVEFRRCF